MANLEEATAFSTGPGLDVEDRTLVVLVLSSFTPLDPEPRVLHPGPTR